MSDPEGQRTHVVTFGVDVSAERRLLDEIESTRALLQSVLDVVPVSITLKGQDLRFRLVNRMHEQWLGLPEGTAVGQTVNELFPLEPWCDTIAEQDRQFLAGESNCATTELDIAPCPSEARSVQVRRTAVRNNRGELEGVLSVGIDVTDINRANRELKQLTAELEQRVRERTSELEETGRFLSAVLTGAPGPIVVWGPEGGIRSFNPAAAELTGCADAEALAGVAAVARGDFAQRRPDLQVLGITHHIIPALAVHPKLNFERLARVADRLGSCATVVNIDPKRVLRDGREAWEVFVSGGRVPTGLDAVAWAREVERLGAGEIVLTCMDRDGTRDGYDLEITAAVSRAVGIPVVASGGAGRPEHLADAIELGRADAALAAGMESMSEEFKRAGGEIYIPISKS